MLHVAVHIIKGWPGPLPPPCRFFLFLVIMLLVHQSSVSIFRAIGALCRAVVLSNMVSFLYVGGALLFNGFIIEQSELLSCF